VISYVTSNTLVYTQHSELRIQARISMFLNPLNSEVYSGRYIRTLAHYYKIKGYNVCTTGYMRVRFHVSPLHRSASHLYPTSRFKGSVQQTSELLKEASSHISEHTVADT